MAPETRLRLPNGRAVELRRPGRQPDNLRAWDAADELALLHLVDHPPSPGPLVVGNDGFGALAVGLTVGAGTERSVASWSDSWVAHHAARANADANGVDPSRVTWLPAAEPPPGDATAAIVKVPKAHELLERQLTWLAARLPAGAPVIGAGMTRHVHRRTVELFAELIGPTRTTKARKKARLVLATRGDDVVEAPSHGWVERYDVEGVAVRRWPGVFGSGGLDHGTALLLDALEVPAGPVDVVDLGCGTGVVGAVVAARNDEAALTFTDDSSLAVASARQTFDATHPERTARFHHAGGLAACEEGSADLVVVNPPFHRGHEVGDEVAWGMFADARRVLRPGGRLVAVGNRHLGYHAKLKRLYGAATVLASNPTFVVLAATRR